MIKIIIGAIICCVGLGIVFYSGSCLIRLRKGKYVTGYAVKSYPIQMQTATKRKKNEQVIRYKTTYQIPGNKYQEDHIVVDEILTEEQVPDGTSKEFAVSTNGEICNKSAMLEYLKSGLIIAVIGLATCLSYFL